MRDLLDFIYQSSIVAIEGMYFTFSGLSCVAFGLCLLPLVCFFTFKDASMKRFAYPLVALLVLSVFASAAQAGPIRAIGRGVRAVAGKVVGGAGRVARGVRGVGRGLRGDCGG